MLTVEYRWNDGSGSSQQAIPIEKWFEKMDKLQLKPGVTLISRRMPSGFELPIQTIKFGYDGVDSTQTSRLIDIDNKVVCRTLPSYSEACRNGVIVMNPYERTRETLDVISGVVGKDTGVVDVKFAIPCGPVFDNNTAGYAEVVYLNSTMTPPKYFTYRNGICWAFVDGDLPFKEKVTLSGPPVSDLPTVSTTDLEGSVFTELLAAVAQADFDLATNVGEMKQTISMFHDILPDLFKTLSELRRFRHHKSTKTLMEKRMKLWQIRKAALELPNEVADYWLKWRYGVRPLYFATQDLVKALDKMKKPVFQTVRTGDSTDFEFNSWSGRCSVRCNGVWKGRFSDDSDSSRKFSLYLPLAMWELYPYSFVVDWVVNVGNYIQSFRPLPTLTSNSCISTKLDLDLKFNEEYVVSPSNNLLVTTTVQRNQRLFKVEGRLTKQRQVLQFETGVLRRQSFRRGKGSRKLVLNTDLTLNQKIDSLALLYKQLARRRRRSFWSI